MTMTKSYAELEPIIDGFDKVELASLESFPASDAPSWIWVESNAPISQNLMVTEVSTFRPRSTVAGVSANQ